MGAQWKAKNREAAANAKGRIFTKLAREIMVAARAGADPDMNPRLRLVVDQAKKASMPRDTVERAIKKGAGLVDAGVNYEKLTYEGFAPHRVPVIVECLTDNVNRTVTNIRILFRKGQLGTSGSVSWDFDYLGMIEAPPASAGADAEAAAIEAVRGVDVVNINDLANSLKIVALPGETMRVRIIKPGEIVFMDLAALTWNGYKSCYYRTYMVGREPNQEQKDYYQIALKWLYDSIKAVKVGATTRDIASQWPSAKEAWGYEEEDQAAANLWSHGLGLAQYDQPVISRIWSLDHPLKIEPGMVFALETQHGKIEGLVAVKDPYNAAFFMDFIGHGGFLLIYFGNNSAGV